MDRIESNAVKMKRAPQFSTGSVSTFYHFRRTMSSEQAYKYVKEFVDRAPTHYGPNPLSMSTRRYLTAHYDRRVMPLERP